MKNGQSASRFLILALAPLLFLCLLNPLNANAQTPFPRVSTPYGALLTRDGKGRECGQYSIQCQVLTLNGKKLFADFAAYISAVYPSKESPSLVTVTVCNGGNAIPCDNYILDLTTSSPLIIKDFGFDKEIFQSENGVIFKKYINNDEIGDFIYGLYKYVLGTGRPQLLQKFPEYSMTPIQQKQTATDVLNDPLVREPILRAVGKSNFSDFRNSMAVAGREDFQIIGDRFVVGSGCTPHACNSMGGMFVIDQRRNVAWALTWENDKGATLWGVLRKDDTVPLKLIGKWLQTNNLTWSMVKLAPLPPDVANAYASSKISEEKPRPNAYSDASGKVNINIAAGERKSSELTPVLLFKMLAPSIYIVNAKRGNGDEFQGSAVAISSDTLLTNCHVVDGAVEIKLTQKGRGFDVSIVSANVSADRCILRTSSHLDSYVSIRPYDELEIGEKLYSIGAPLGLELTLSDGLLSGKRTLAGSRLVQTTAPISPGSSGGGLFDAYGNLVGITTFLLKESENLNFAIAAQEYLQQ